MREKSFRSFVACFFLLLVFRPGAARAPLAFHPGAVRAQDPWVEVRSQHFAVVSDAGEERARDVAAMLETIREVYVQALPDVPPQGGPPLEVFALKDRDGLQELLPQYADRDPRQLPLGVYIATTDKDFIVLLESAEGENPFETVFHEYFHSIASPLTPWAPRCCGC